MKKFINCMSIAACYAIVGFAAPASAQENVPVFDRLPLFGQSDASDLSKDVPEPAAEPKIAAMPERDALVKASGDSDAGWEARNPSLERLEESPSLKNRPTAAEIRQARAMYTMKHRMARLERDAWRGREPLRPNFHGIPNAATMFYNQPRYIVPIYYFGR